MTNRNRLLAVATSFLLTPVLAIASPHSGSGSPGELETSPASPLPPALLPAATVSENITARLGGRVFYDISFNNADTDFAPTEGTYYDNAEFRSARIGVEGVIYDAIEYKVDYEFAGGTVMPRDVWAQTRLGCGMLRVGHFYEPFGLEENTDGEFLTFAERSLASALSPGRNGYSGALSYFLTGEHRTYRHGSFGRVVPASNYANGSGGAVARSS